MSRDQNNPPISPSKVSNKMRVGMAFEVGFKELNINWGTWFEGRKKLIDICDHLTLKALARPGVLERVANLLSTIADTIEVI